MNKNKEKEKNHQSQIRINVTLNEDKIPTQILWDADDTDSKKKQEVAAILLGLWDKEKKKLINFDLWTNEMPIHDMKMFQINLLGALAENMRKSTGDEYMAENTHNLADKFYKYHRNNLKKSLQ